MKSIIKMASAILFMSAVSLMACDTCAKHAKKPAVCKGCDKAKAKAESKEAKDAAKCKGCDKSAKDKALKK
jgi:hypothetical protein